MTIKEEFSWQRLTRQAEGLLSVSSDRISNAANLSALIFQEVHDISWVGFYLLHGRTLLLGPFQGKPACTRIPLGKGVCGTAAGERRTVVVQNVHEYPGHIACDAASNSEIVVPLIQAGRLLGVLDIDSPSLGRFDEEDQVGLEAVVADLLAATAAAAAT